MHSSTIETKSRTLLIPGIVAAVLFFLFTAAATPAWAQQTEDAKLLASDGAYGDYFGESVAASGDVIVVCADGDDIGSEQGSAYVFRYDPGSATWIQEQKLLPAVNDGFAKSAAVDGDVIVIGASHAGVNLTGAAYVFRYDSGAGTWSEEQKLVASDGDDYDRFGVSVSISGDAILVGAYGDDPAGSSSGSAYVFRYDPGSESWIEEDKLVASDGSSGAHFGESVSLSGGVALVGANGDSVIQDDMGSAYVFRFDSGSGSWIEEDKLTASNGAEDDKFGSSVSVSGDAAVIGAPFSDVKGNNSGAAYAFRYDSGSGSWIEEADLTPSDGFKIDNFGNSIFIDGDTALIGSVGDGVCEINTGSAYLYRYDPGAGSWSAGPKLYASDGANLDRFGASVALSGGFAVVGAGGDDDLGNGSGSAYVFDATLAAAVPDIKVNGLDGPLTLTTGDDVTVKVALDPGDFDGVDADWWVVARKVSSGTWWAQFRPGLKPKWTKSTDPIPFAGATMRTVNGYKVLGPPTLPAGTWNFAFALDYKNDKYEGTHIDLVKVTVN